MKRTINKIIDNKYSLDNLAYELQNIKNNLYDDLVFHCGYFVDMNEFEKRCTWEFGNVFLDEILNINTPNTTIKFDRDIVTGEILDIKFVVIIANTASEERKVKLIFDDSIYFYDNSKIHLPIFNDEIPHLKKETKMKLPEIKKVIFNDPATIVLWSDGTKTVVKAENEAFDQEKGLAMAICKKALGTNESKANYYDIFKKWIQCIPIGNVDVNII